MAHGSAWDVRENTYLGSTALADLNAEQFALTEASYVIVRMLQRFDSLQNLDFDEMTHNLTLTSSPGGGVRVRLHQAESVSV